MYHFSRRSVLIQTGVLNGRSLILRVSSNSYYNCKSLNKIRARKAYEVTKKADAHLRACRPVDYDVVGHSFGLRSIDVFVDCELQEEWGAGWERYCPLELDLERGIHTGHHGVLFGHSGQWNGALQREWDYSEFGYRVFSWIWLLQPGHCDKVIRSRDGPFNKSKVVM